MSSFPLRRVLAALLLTAALPSFGQSSSGASGAAAKSSDSTQRVAKMVDLTKPSSIETMYDVLSDSLSQYGYETFVTVVPSVLPRGRIPEPYQLGPGDGLTVLLWGDPVDLGELAPQSSLTVAADGTVFYPPVGQLRVDGMLRSDAEKSFANGLAKKYKRFDLRLQVTPQRVFPLTVTGLVGQPGIVMVDPWTSVLEILAQSGGVQKNGTLRNLKLVKADGREVGIDLYDLLIKGRRLSVKIEEGDVLWVGPIGKTVAVAGLVKVPGIYEVKPDETLADLMSFAGGTLVSASGAPLSKTSWSGDVWLKTTVNWNPSAPAAVTIQDGDIFAVRALSVPKTSDKLPGFVQVSGEVVSPGFVAWKDGMTMADALAQVGGLLPSANLAGATLRRDSIVATQRAQNALANRNNGTQIAAVQAKIATTTDALVLAALNEELSVRLELSTFLSSSSRDGSLGKVQIEDVTGKSVFLQADDSIVVPKQSGVVYLLGSVYNPGAQLWKKGLTVRAAIDAVGGVNLTGNWDGVYVVRANGRVDSVSARGNFLGLSSLWGEQLGPGDLVFVPTTSADSTQVWSLTKDVVALLAQSTTTLTNVFVLLKTLNLL